jgi:3-phenylpropionate/trans-cinnamate dioxygenase ferredoxin reductase component
MTNKIIIIGGGHAGGMTAIYLRQNNYSGEILIISNEGYLPYQRPALSKGFLTNEVKEERLYLKNTDYFKRNNINFLLKTNVKKIDRLKKIVIIDDEKSISYDKLVLATGSEMIHINSSSSKILYLRTLDESKKLREFLSNYNSLAIIGAGYIGLEVASAASKKSLDVNIFEMGSRLMERSSSEIISDFFLTLHKKNGVTFNLNTAVNDVSDIDNGILIHSSKKKESISDFLVVGIGVTPNTKLAQECGLDCNNGIKVDKFGCTSDKNIFATGDCTNHPNSIFNINIRLESVQNAVEQSKIVANNICGISKSYENVPWFWSDQYDAKLKIAGIKEGYDYQIQLGSVKKSSFSIISLKEDKVICIESVNRSSDFTLAKKLIASQKVMPKKILVNSKKLLKEIMVNT